MATMAAWTHLHTGHGNMITIIDWAQSEKWRTLFLPQSYHCLPDLRPICITGAFFDRTLPPPDPERLITLDLWSPLDAIGGWLFIIFSCYGVAISFWSAHFSHTAGPLKDICSYFWFMFAVWKSYAFYHKTAQEWSDGPSTLPTIHRHC